MSGSSNHLPRALHLCSRRRGELTLGGTHLSSRLCLGSDHSCSHVERKKLGHTESSRSVRHETTFTQGL